MFATRDQAVRPAQTKSVRTRSHEAAANNHLNSSWRALAFQTATANQHNPSDRTIGLRFPSFKHPLLGALSRPGVRFRVPSFDKLKAAYTDKTLKIPESVIKDRVATLLSRMAFEKRLKTTDDVPTIMSKIFPGPGKIDEAEFNNALDVKDRTVIYEAITEAQTTVKVADKPKLKTAMTDAADLMKKVQSDSTGLTEVFGTEDATAKANYEKGRKALLDVSKDISGHVSTDYNLDDPETFLGGWADFGAKHIHLLAEVVRVTNQDKAKITIIHEASHLADSKVDDHGYYASKNFEAMEAATKVNNAAHYEELPRRELGVSKFPGQTFTPNVSSSGTPVTREDKIQRDASEFLRMAWDAAVDTHSFIRGVRLAYLSGSTKPFSDNAALILEISKLMDLTIHEQASAAQLVTTLDVTITESVARGTNLVKEKAKTIPFPSPIGSLTDLELRDQIIAEAVKAYGQLLRDASRDKKLLQWFVDHYRSLPSL